MADDQEHEGASVREQLCAACRNNNVEMLQEIISNCKNEDEISDLMNNTKSPVGDHLFHIAAKQGNYEIIDMLLDQPNFECDPVNREGDTPLHSTIRWINSEPPAQREFGKALVEMMLIAGCDPRAKTRGKQSAASLVDPRNKDLKEIIQKQEYANLMAGDFVNADDVNGKAGEGGDSASDDEDGGRR